MNKNNWKDSETQKKVWFLDVRFRLHWFVGTCYISLNGDIYYALKKKKQLWEGTKPQPYKVEVIPFFTGGKWDSVNYNVL